jgi:DNA-binding NtrC family response regulator
MPKDRTRAKKLAAAHVLLVNGAKSDYADALTGAGYRVTTVETMRDALATRSRADAVIVELVIPEGTLSGIQEAVKKRRRTRAMMVIALAEDTHQEAVVKAGATFCRQPCPPDELVRFVDRTLALRGTLKDGEGQRSTRRV